MKANSIFCRWFPSWFIPGLEDCDRSSCWRGSNAQGRMMNTPGMSDGKFKEYLKWQKGRGANTAHIILNNQGDGENAKYCIYGNSVDWAVDKAFCKKVAGQMLAYRRAGIAVFPWILTDDSSAWNREIAKNFPKLMQDIKSAGLLKYASGVVAVLETQDSYNATQLAALIRAIRDVYKGDVGTHEISFRLEHAGLGDFPMYQTPPEKASPSWCCAEAKRVEAALGGKRWGYFEIDRHERPDIAKALADLKLKNLFHIGCC